DSVAVDADGGADLLDVFVEVVAEIHHDVGVLVGEVPVGAEIALLVVGAGHEAEPHAVDRRSGGGRGHGGPDPAYRIPAHEPVPVWLAGLQAGDVGMNRPSEGRFGVGRAAADDVAHAVVGGDLVVHRHIAAGHAAGGCRIDGQRIRGE